MLLVVHCAVAAAAAAEDAEVGSADGTVVAAG